MAIEQTEFGKALLECRLSKGWTQQQLDRLSGVSYVAISNLECGKNKPNPLTARKLAVALGDEKLLEIALKTK